MNSDVRVWRCSTRSGSEYFLYPSGAVTLVSTHSVEKFLSWALVDRSKVTDVKDLQRGVYNQPWTSPRLGDTIFSEDKTTWRLSTIITEIEEIR